MTELLDGSRAWVVLALAVLIFSLLPHAVINVIVLLYPPGHLRRAELRAEVHCVPRWQKPFWVAEQLCTVVTEGLPLRVAAARANRRRKRESQTPTLYGVDLVYVKGEARRQIRELLQSSDLTGTQLQIVKYRFGEGLTDEETGRELGTTPQYVTAQYLRALTKMQRSLQDSSATADARCPDGTNNPLP